MSSRISQRGRPALVDDGSIVDAVTDAIWRTGFAGTSISDISTASGVARASLYKLFGDKDGLLIAALDRYAARFDLRVVEILEKTDDPAEAVSRTLQASADRLTDPDAPDGCLRCRATLEVKGRGAEVDAAIARANAGFEANMRRLLDADGRGRATDAAMARTLTALVNGMVILAEAGGTRSVLHEIVDGAVAEVRARL